jgi:L-ascorbate metabolism protein UlaG (beta-lactamase superfamily)
MKKALIAIMALAAGFSAALFALTPDEALKRLSWYGQGSLRIELGGKIVWIDPVGVRVPEKADLILITHDHQDHYSAADVERLSGPATRVFAGFDAPGATRIKPGESIKLGELEIEAVPAYNIVKKSAHPKSALYCGFVLSAEGVRVYDAGDTERIPEMKAISCDIVLVPLGQTYTMNSVDEAVQSALDVKAVIAIPIHYGLYEGTEGDADAFVAALKAKGVAALRLPKKK